MSRTKNSLLIASVLALLGACSSTPMAPTAAPAATSAMAPAAAPPVAASPAAAPQPTAASTVTTVTLPPYLDPKSSLSTDRSVFFDFDEYTVKPQYTAMVERHGKFLASSPSVAIKVEGNTDERGGTEYNLALGQKRAEAVRRALMIYGVRDAQVEAISWGESKPMAQGRDEAAWAQNRRADLQYPAR